MDERVVKPVVIGTQLFILFEGEKFTLDGKYYKNEDESLFIRSSCTTGKLIVPNET